MDINFMKYKDISKKKYGVDIIRDKTMKFKIKQSYF